MMGAHFGKCDKCGEEGKLFPSFGKWICEKCKNNRPRKGTGNSGMFQSKENELCFDDELKIVRCKKSNDIFGAMFFRHYPGSKGIPGRSLCYLIFYKFEIIGIIGFNSPPKNYTKFVDFFGANMENNYLINNVFRIEKPEKNLGTKILKLARAIVKDDYEKKYNESLIGLCTFVEKPRSGAIYKADNWIFLGESEGKRMRRNSETWEKEFTSGEQKLIFAYKYKTRGH